MNFNIIIPSARAENLVPCVQAVMQCEPELDPRRIIVIDDGARANCNIQGLTWITGIKPFVYSRNCNLGILLAAGEGIVLLNDDALIQTPGGFTAMAEASQGWGLLGPTTNCSGNPNQLKRYNDGLVRLEPNRCIPFLCVYIPRKTIEHVGLLDERFTGYGFEDMDYCRRTREAGLRLGIFDGCFIDHLSLKSTYRGNPGTPADLSPGRKIYERKWGAGAD